MSSPGERLGGRSARLGKVIWRHDLLYGFSSLSLHLGKERKRKRKRTDVAFFECLPVILSGDVCSDGGLCIYIYIKEEKR